MDKKLIISIFFYECAAIFVLYVAAWIDLFSCCSIKYEKCVSLAKRAIIFPPVHDFPASTHSNLNTDNARDTVLQPTARNFPSDSFFLSRGICNPTQLGIRIFNPKKSNSRNITGNSFMLPCRYVMTDLTFCYLPGDLTLCHLKASEIHLYGAGGGGGRKKRRLAERAETQMSANKGSRLSFCRGCGLFPHWDCRGT